MTGILFTSVELGLLYALGVLGGFLTLRILNFADLSVDGSFVRGGGGKGYGDKGGGSWTCRNSRRIFGGFSCRKFDGFFAHPARYRENSCGDFVVEYVVHYQSPIDGWSKFVTSKSRKHHQFAKNTNQSHLHNYFSFGDCVSGEVFCGLVFAN